MGVVLRAPRVPRGGNGGGTGRGNEGRTWESSAPTPPTGGPSTGECNAVLVSWNRQKRFGFVEVELGGSPRKVFLHRSALGGAPPPIGSALRVSIQAQKASRAHSSLRPASHQFPTYMPHCLFSCTSHTPFSYMSHFLFSPFPVFPTSLLLLFSLLRVEGLAWKARVRGRKS